VRVRVRVRVTVLSISHFLTFSLCLFSSAALSLSAGTLGIVLMWVSLARSSLTTATPISSTLSAPNTDDATDNAKEASGSAECSTARMLHWAQRRGAALRNIDVYHFATGRGVRYKHLCTYIYISIQIVCIYIFTIYVCTYTHTHTHTHTQYYIIYIYININI
jgi:hypothetical protein